VGTLGTAQDCTVTATASEGGSGTVTTTSSFRTLTPGQTTRTEIFEAHQQTYGVGMPIMLTFSHLGLAEFGGWQSSGPGAGP
jgi:Bacterial Ig domain